MSISKTRVVTNNFPNMKISVSIRATYNMPHHDSSVAWSSLQHGCFPSWLWSWLTGKAHGCSWDARVRDHMWRPYPWLKTQNSCCGCLRKHIASAPSEKRNTKNASKLEHHKSGTLCVFQGYASWLESHCVHLCLGTRSVRKASQEQQQKASTSEKSLYFHRAVNLTPPEPRGLAMLLTQHKGSRESNRTQWIHSRAPKGWFGLPRFLGSLL